MKTYNESVKIEKDFWFQNRLHNLYRFIWDGDIEIEIVQDKERQIRGIDKIIHFVTGQVLHIDEKIRSKEYPDILLERWSNQEKRIPGWLFREESDTDYYVYCFKSVGICFLIPAHEVKVWANANEEVLKTFQVVQAPNHDYTTISYAIPISKFKELFPAIKKYKI